MANQWGLMMHRNPNVTGSKGYYPCALTKEQVIAVAIEFGTTNQTVPDLASKYGISISSLRAILKGHSYKLIDRPTYDSLARFRAARGTA